MRTALSHQEPALDRVDLTFAAHLPVPPDLCPTFSFYKLRSFSTLETVFETLVRCLPGVGPTEINSCLVSPPLGFSAFGFCQQREAEPDLFGTPGASPLAPLCPGCESKLAQN